MIEKFLLTSEKWSFLLSEKKPDINAELNDTIYLPSTVQQMKKSPLNSEKNDGFLTDPYRFEGYALYERIVDLTPKNADCDVFLVMERTRTTNLWIDGKHVGTQNSLCAPHKYNITEYMKFGVPVKITVMVDNISCPVPGGHMTSQDTQTNWLGITGEIYLEFRNRLRYENIKISPDPESKSVTVSGDIIGGNSIELTAEVNSFGSRTVTLTKGNPTFVYELPNSKLWSEHEPNTYIMKISTGGDTEKISFGMRKFETRGTEFLLNGEKIFLRGKHDGMIFPMTGAAPTDIESWMKILKTAKDYGINHYRFHTCCPPEAAFEAADRVGIYLEPELPFWGTVEDELTDGQKYLIGEGFKILDSFGNHPSFFALSLGNELWGSKERLNEILGDYKKYDPRPLYTQGSNNFQFYPCILDNDDFFVGVRFSRERLFRGSYAMCDAPLGHIQTDAPNSDYNYDERIKPNSVSNDTSAGGTIEIQYGTGVKTVSVDNSSGEFVSNVPVVSHEVGQYFMYPDYGEIEKYTGVLKPHNFEIFRDRLEKAGLAHLADKYFRASGRFAAECYKNEIETALRSKELSGFQLLDIQDFTGQGTALVGILNSFMESKGIITAVEWRNFCADRVLLGCLPRFVFAAGETVGMGVKLYSYASQADVDPTVTIKLSVGGEVVSEQNITAKGSFKGGVFDLGTADIVMPNVENAEKIVLNLSYKDICNKYILWVYSNVSVTSSVTTDWSTAKTELSEGKSVLFIPQNLNEENSVEGFYCTDFWNYPMFRSISESMKKPVPVGTLGLLIDKKHPALDNFPTESYSTAQWYDIVRCSRAAILDDTGIEPIVRTIDNCERNHSLGTIFEMKAGGGKLLVCTAALDEQTNSMPCQALLKSLTNYVSSEKFEPSQTVEIDVLDKLFG